MGFGEGGNPGGGGVPSAPGGGGIAPGKGGGGIPAGFGRGGGGSGSAGEVDAATWDDAASGSAGGGGIVIELVLTAGDVASEGISVLGARDSGFVCNLSCV